MNQSDKKPVPVVVVGDPSPTKEYDEFYKWVGICIKGWAAVEDRMFELCAPLMEIKPFDTAAMIQACVRTSATL